MADLSAADIQQALEQAGKYTDELDTLAKANGVDIKVSGNDAGDLLKASGAAAATGAAIGAAVGTAFPPALPFVIAAGAIIGAIAGFFSKFKFGPSAERIKLAAEWDKLNQTIGAILATVPEPDRATLGHILIEGMRQSPGPLPFCLSAAEGGCVATTMQGARDAAAGINQHIQDLLVAAQAKQAATSRKRLWWGAGGLVVAGGIGYALLRKEGKRS